MKFLFEKGKENGRLPICKRCMYTYMYIQGKQMTGWSVQKAEVKRPRGTPFTLCTSCTAAFYTSFPINVSNSFYWLPTTVVHSSTVSLRLRAWRVTAKLVRGVLVFVFVVLLCDFFFSRGKDRFLNHTQK